MGRSGATSVTGVGFSLTGPPVSVTSALPGAQTGDSEVLLPSICMDFFLKLTKANVKLSEEGSQVHGKSSPAALRKARTLKFGRGVVESCFRTADTRPTDNIRDRHECQREVVCQLDTRKKYDSIVSVQGWSMRASR